MASSSQGSSVQSKASPEAVPGAIAPSATRPTSGSSGRGSAWLRHLRAGSGLVLFAFVLGHLINHALLLISINAAEQGRFWLAAPWRTITGTGLLYGAAALHVALTLYTLYRRQTLAMPMTELLRLTLGLLIPYFIVDHAVNARLGIVLGGNLPSYVQVIRSLWVTTPAVGVQQVIALVVIWVHGVIGIAFLLRPRAGWKRFFPYFLGIAVLLPALSLLGYAVTGRLIVLQSRFPDIATGMSFTEANHSLLAQHAQAMREIALANIAVTIKMSYICLIGAIFVLRGLRLYRLRAKAVVVRYESGAIARVPPGSSVLEASRTSGIPHYSICGGNARCSTCRVRVLKSQKPLPPPSQAERATLARIGADPDMRLGCQLRPAGDITVKILLEGADRTNPAGEAAGTAFASPRERELAVLFCDLRHFTEFSEKRLPYDVVFLLNRYFVLVGEAVTGAGGRVDKFIGDGAMALFGFDEDPQAACRNALTAAQEILENIAKLNAELDGEDGAAFEIAIGIHFGPAVVGVMGYGATQSETAIGDTVNVASRLEAVAKEMGAPLAISAEVLRQSGLALTERQFHKSAIRGRQEEVNVALLTADDLNGLLTTEPEGAETKA